VLALAPYLERSLVELVLLAGLAGVLGTWVVLRGLAFFTHAIGTATFPGLVVAGPWGIPAQLAGLGAALGFGGALERVARTRRVDPDAATGLLLVGALAAGVVLASDVYHSGAGVDRLLFGSLIALQPADLWLTAAALAASLVADAGLARVWLAGGFDADAARAGGVRTALADRLLLLAVAAAVAVCLSAVGALLVSVILVVPAATVRRFEPRLRVQQAATVALAAAEGVVAVLVADALDVGAGPAMAVVGAAVFALASVAGDHRRSQAGRRMAVAP
jgi:manganese/iron transport system permease protein